MTKHVDYSHDMQQWFVARSFEVGAQYSYMRVIEEFEKTWDKQKIYDVLEQAKDKNIRVEYSQDGGFSWVPLRMNYLPEDVARVITMLSRGYGVRTLQITDIKSGGKVMTQGGMINKLNEQVNIQQYAPRPQQKRPPLNTTITVWRSGEYYFFSKLPERQVKQSDSNAEVVSYIQSTTYYDMHTPNANDVKIVSGAADLNFVAAEGLIFRLSEFKDNPDLQHWGDVLGYNLDDYIVCECAKHYDSSFDLLFAGINILAVLGGKYQVRQYNRYKAGNMWIFHKGELPTLLNRIQQGLGYIENQTFQQLEETEQIKIETKDFTAEVTPEYIMQVTQQLRELLAADDEAQLTEGTFRIIEYRNKCVDAIRELNSVIDEARKRLLSNANTTRN